MLSYLVPKLGRIATLASPALATFRVIHDAIASWRISTPLLASLLAESAWRIVQICCVYVYGTLVRPTVLAVIRLITDSWIVDHLYRRTHVVPSAGQLDIATIWRREVP
jgi:hypothetical protein